MKNTTHRVVILKNVNSEIISQAILILKDNVSATDSCVIMEAEKIVERYMGKKHTPFPKQKPSAAIAGLLSAGIILTGAVLFFLYRLI